VSASGKPNGKTKPELSLGDMIIYLLIAVLMMLYFLLLAALVVALAPGMLVVAAIKSAFHPSLDVAQCWTFAILVSAGFLLLLFRRYRDWTKAAAGYLMLSGTIIVVSIVAHYGYKANYPRAVLAAYFPSLKQ